MSKKVISIETGILWTKVALVEANRKSPHVYDVFRFRTPEHAIEDGYIRDKENFAKVLKEELTKHQIFETAVNFSINSSKVITREISIPFVKDKQIENVVNAQAREYFPMDISSYTISFRKMDTVETPEGKQLKILLFAIPDNLLTNYCSFAETMGLEIENFEYVGNSAVSFINSYFTEDSVVVQIEEQATIFSMISDKKIVFQRITPYGYGTALSSVLDHSVFGVNDEYEAFEFLKTHDVLHTKPNAVEFENSGIEDLNRRQEVLEEAYADVKEAIGYHMRVVYTALEYYQNQAKGDFKGRLRLIGDGVQFAGIKKMFRSEIPLECVDANYAMLIQSAKAEAGFEGFASFDAAGYLSVIGATINPIKITPKEWKEKEDKKNTLQTAYYILAVAGAISVLLILIGTIRELVAVTQAKKLDNRISELAYIQDIYAENEELAANAGKLQAFQAVTQTPNENLGLLIFYLENKLPTSMTVQNLTIIESSITLNMSCDHKLTAAQMLLNFKEIPFLQDVTIPTMAEVEDESGNTSWQFTVTANYKPMTEEEIEALGVVLDFVEDTQPVENTEDTEESDEDSDEDSDEESNDEDSEDNEDDDNVTDDEENEDEEN